MENRFEKYPVITSLAIVSVLTGLLLVGAEIILASLQKKDQNVAVERFIRLREPAPLIDITVTPNAGMISSMDGLVQKPYRYRADSNGFIEPSIRYSQPDLTIVFLGGSTTECMYMDEGDRFPYRVGLMLEKRLHKKVNSINAGFAGNHSMHSLDVFINKVIPLKPHYVVMMHNVNDLIVLMLDSAYWADHPSRGMIVTVEKRKATLRSALTELKDATIPETYKMLWINGLSRFFHPEANGDEWAHKRGSKIIVRRDDWIREFSSSLKSFVGIARAWGITPVLMTQANRYIPHPDKSVAETMYRAFEKSYGMSYAEYKAIYDDFSETIRRVAAEENVMLIDLDRDIPKTDRMMYDGVHFLPEGSLFAADIIASQFANSIVK